MSEAFMGGEHLRLPHLRITEVTDKPRTWVVHGNYDGVTVTGLTHDPTRVCLEIEWRVGNDSRVTLMNVILGDNPEAVLIGLDSVFRNTSKLGSADFATL